ncbi:MAG TPA: SAM-dependent methyltransferase [Pyrinomonadaceae bacterium]|nr:SAM-dependent methyltransferase [Pyrinomonadaceae bacterium]
MLTSFVVQPNIEKLVAELRLSLANSTFVKLTLSNYKGDDEHLQKILIRLVDTKKSKRLVFQSRYDNRDIVKNFDFDDGSARIAEYLKTGFRSAHLFTTERDFQLTIGKKNSRLIQGKPTFRQQPDTLHDRKKKHLIDPSAYYLKALRITTDSGQIRADQRDKWTQINKFVEILAGLVANSSLKDKSELRVVDMGSGKGYLTFAVFDFLSSFIFHPLFLSVTGVEQRKNLVDICNDIARASDLQGLKFIQSTIVDFDPGDVDILIALHACDTATDDALYKGIKASAEIVIAAPCCHHELKKQIKPPELFAGILKHHVMLERTAETLTDGIRSMLLEANGYKTKMFEFVATEHTPKNNLLVAIKHVQTKGQNGLRGQIERIRTEFGIEHHRLADLLDQ